MQVRPIEFQENFARVPVEGARQQSLLQREPELAQQHAAQLSANEQVLNLTRPRPTTETEGTIVDPDGERFPGRRFGSTSRNRRTGNAPTEEERRPGTDGVSGTRIDLVG